jgi:hypothetical protein
MSDVIAPCADPTTRPDPLEIEPCELGCAIEDLEELIYLRAADLIAQWERADPRDRWRHTGEQPPRTVEPAPAAAQPYRTPQATIDAFMYVARLDDPEYLARWLADHKRDAAHLLKIWKAKQC